MTGVQTCALPIFERWRSRIRRAAAKVTHPTGAASSRLGVPSKGFFFLFFLKICMVPVVVFSFFCELMAFSLQFFLCGLQTD